MDPAPGLEADLLRKIVEGRSPGYMASVLEEFNDIKGLPMEVTYEPGEPIPDPQVIVLAKNLARKGLITYDDPAITLGWPQVEATARGRQWVRDHPA